MISPGQYASIQIGKLVCQGTKKIPKNETADSCSNLKKSGVVDSGNFILNDESVAFCDMEKPVDDNDIQKHVGDLTYKTSMFVAMSNGYYGDIQNGTIVFDSTEFDYSGDFENSTGTFTAPREGVYSFIFHAFFSKTDFIENTAKYIDVYVNDERTNYFKHEGNDNGQYTQWWSLTLKMGDKVHLSNRNENQLYVQSYYPMFFAGYYVG